jgi:hypothetical protein
MEMDCPVSLMAKRIPCPVEKSRIGRAPTSVPVFSTCTTPLPTPYSGDQVLEAVQPYMFAPAAATVRKYMSPWTHVGGNAPPVEKGLVDGADPKSTVLDCVRRSTCVCAARGIPTAKMDHAIDRIMGARHSPS